jgi:uncharacterized protein with GYD domain
MPIYISRGRFTTDGVKDLMPKNREEALSKLFKNIGGRLIGWYLTFGPHDWLVIGEQPQQAASHLSPIPAASNSRSSPDRTSGVWSQRVQHRSRMCQ